MGSLSISEIAMKNIAFNEDGTITVTNLDGSSTVFSSAAPAPVVHPDSTEVDLVLSDGTDKKFVPAA